MTRLININVDAEKKKRKAFCFGWRQASLLNAKMTVSPITELLALALPWYRGHPNKQGLGRQQAEKL